MHVLVTGGAGFIGSHLVRALLARGERVTVVDNLATGAPATLPDGAELLEKDIADPGVVPIVSAAGPDAIVHAAAQVSVIASVADPERDAAVNVTGTAHILEAARSCGAPRFVFLSSGGAIYGEADGASESTTPAPINPYGRNKLRAEGLVVAAGLPFGIARIANVCGPGQRAGLEGGVVAIVMDRLARGEPITVFGDGEQRRDFVHVEDVARALLAMLDTTRDGLWNVGTGQSTSVNELIRMAEEATGRRSPVEHAAPREGEVRVSRLAVERIAVDLGWAPRISLEEGLAGLAQEAVAS